MAGIEFEWKAEEISILVDSCKNDESVRLISESISDTNSRILEAGCGSGRVVKYFYDLGYKKMAGIELNKEAVSNINTLYPELEIIHGDLLRMPYQEKSFDFVISLGVIEHFQEGLALPLESIKKVLKINGIAIITVPSFNLLRRLIYFSKIIFNLINPKKNQYIRTLFKKHRILQRQINRPYYVSPQQGEFFEYWFTPSQFEHECKQAGFEIVKSVPICHIDGLYHIFHSWLGDTFIEFRDWKFKISKSAHLINWMFKTIPFLHNHMHGCILKRIN